MTCVRNMSGSLDVTDTVYFIGCGVLGPDVSFVAQQKKLSLQKKMLPGGLHNTPDVLREKLQAAIHEAAADQSCKRIIVGYGLCGNGSVGIWAPKNIPLVFPKVQDCIALFLGSDQAYRDQFSKYPGTFYISSGWYLEKEKAKENKAQKVWLGNEAMGCEEVKEKYGEKRGKDIIDFFSTWQQNYQRAAFIDTGSGKTWRHEEYAKKMAKDFNWEYQPIKGSLALITKLLCATESDADILVVPPGKVTIYSSIANGLGAAVSTEEGRGGATISRSVTLGEKSEANVDVSYGLGVDAGGTYTDAAIYNFHEKRVCSKNKALTTKWDFSVGIHEALAGLDQEMLGHIELVSISTTLATNSIVEGEGQKAGLLLMSGPGSIPDELEYHSSKAVIGGSMTIAGVEKEPVNPEEVRRAAREMIERDGVSAFAVTGFGSIANPLHEQQVKKILQDETGFVVCCGHEFSDLLHFGVRGQTAILNARIIPRMLKFFKELGRVLEEHHIQAPVMVVKGDGTLMSSKVAIKRPVETILSGPAASVAGARLLTGLDNTTVVDIGGTTTDTADLVDGLVEVCAHGAEVGGFRTHVKALNMRTVGLGGDSQIAWKNDTLTLGPRRMGPIVWAGFRSTSGVDQALEYMESCMRRGRGKTLTPVVLVGVGGEIPFTPTEKEKKLYDMLRLRPYALDELVEPLGFISNQFIPTARLEEAGLVQRCSLTPTDLLHLKGSFRKWDTEPAERLLHIFSKQSGLLPEELIETVLKKFETSLAEEILTKQLARDVDVTKEHTQLSRHFIDSIIQGGNKGYSIDVTLEHPIVGIGAPVAYFMPAAGRILHAKVKIPEDADVANALGAITSNIVIRKKLSIKMGQLGGFSVQGVSEAPSFPQIETAEEWAIEYLYKEILALAKQAGTRCEVVTIEIVDKEATARNGANLFLEREMSGVLIGAPDLFENETCIEVAVK